MKNPLIAQFGSEKRWVNYRIETLKGKKTKIPYDINGKKASSTDEKSWATYAEAKAVSDQVGITFTPAQDLLGIDIDHCINKETKKIEHPEASAIGQLMIEADTYTEVSPSGEGLHLFLALTAPLKLVANKHAPFEAYTSGRYFTVTGNVYGKEAREVRTVTPEEALEILAIAGYPWGKGDVEEAQAASTVPVEKTTPSDDDVVLKKMFSAKNGTTIKLLYEGDMSEYDNDGSSADMALLSHLAFWTRKDAIQMERIWANSPLGKREKTQKRKDYRDRSIKAAIKGCKEVYESQAEKIEKENPELDLLFTLTQKGDKIFTQNTENICRVLRHHKAFTGTLRFDVFKNKMEMKRNGVWREIKDNDQVVLQTQISILMPCFQKVTKAMVADAMLAVCMENEIDSAADYLRSLVWDQTPRLDTWLTTAYGTPNDEYHQKVGSNWLKGLVNRIINPGCKFDYVMVLEGPQGVKKSTSLATLGGAWHFETSEGTDSKDFFMQFEGKAIVEFSEGETLSRTEVKRMKAIITNQVDRYRPSYGRFSMDFPRRCVFAMTTNAEEYLKDETGNRRWLPVRVELPEADIEWIANNREQLFAEAYHRVITLKETTWDFPREATLAAQRERKVSDANEDPVVEWYHRLEPSKKDEGITAHQVFVGALNNNFNGKMTKYEEMSICNILKDVLDLVKVRNRRDGIRSWRWYEKDSQIAQKGIEVELASEITLDDF